MLLDASSGNSVLRHAAAVGLNLREFDDVLLSHDHPDHMAGLLFVQFDRMLYSESHPPIRVHASDEAMDGLKRHCPRHPAERRQRLRRLRTQRSGP